MPDCRTEQMKSLQAVVDNNCSLLYYVYRERNAREGDIFLKILLTFPFIYTTIKT